MLFCFVLNFSIPVAYTVNSKIFARILFSRIAFKDIFSTLKIRGLGMIYLYQQTTVILLFREGFIFAKIRIREVSPRSRKFLNLD